MAQFFDLKFFEENWKPSIGSKVSEKKVWDSNSVNYRERPIPEPETDLSMKCVTEQGMIDENSRVLDVGCGGGVYSVALGRRCRSLIGTDVSPMMLETARYNTGRYGVTNTEFHEIDWHSYELPEDWKKGFDLVFANMTPAIQSYHTLDLMNQASKKWCYISKPVEWKNSLIYELVDLLGLWDDYRTFDEDMLCAFHVLRLQGYTPYTAYRRTTWHTPLPLEQAVVDYTERINMKKELNEAQRAQIRAFLAERAVNGVVENDTDVLIAAMYWRTDV